VTSSKSGACASQCRSTACHLGQKCCSSRPASCAGASTGAHAATQRQAARSCARGSIASASRSAHASFGRMERCTSASHSLAPNTWRAARRASVDPAARQPPSGAAPPGLPCGSISGRPSGSPPRMSLQRGDVKGWVGSGKVCRVRAGVAGRRRPGASSARAAAARPGPTQAPPPGAPCARATAARARTRRWGATAAARPPGGSGRPGTGPPAARPAAAARGAATRAAAPSRCAAPRPAPRGSAARAPRRGVSRALSFHSGRWPGRIWGTVNAARVGTAGVPRRRHAPM